MDELTLKLYNKYKEKHEKQKNEIIDEINNHIKYHYNKSTDSLYEIQQFINNKDSLISQSLILCPPQLKFGKIDLSPLAPDLINECYLYAQEVLKDFKEECKNIYENLRSEVLNTDTCE